MHNKTFAKKFLNLQRTVFRSERKKRAALIELRSIAGSGFAAAVEALASSPRILCLGGCGRDYMTDEIGESGKCSACFDAATIQKED